MAKMNTGTGVGASHRLQDADRDQTTAEVTRRHEGAHRQLCVRKWKILLAGMRTNFGVLLLASVFAMISWFVTHIVDNVISTPTIEYSVTPKPMESKDGKYRVELRARNLSQEKMSEFSMILLSPNNSDSFKFEEVNPPKVELVPPAYPGRKRVEVFPESARYQVEHLQPGNEVGFSISYMSKDGKAPDFHLVSENPIRAIKKGMRTFIIQHELAILLSVVTLWSVIVCVLIYNIGQVDQKGGS